MIDVIMDIISGEYLEKLRDDGMLCKTTYGRLRCSLRKHLAGLKELGFVPSFSPLAVANAEMLTEFISNAQRELGIGKLYEIVGINRCTSSFFLCQGCVRGVPCANEP